MFSKRSDSDSSSLLGPREVGNGVFWKKGSAFRTWKKRSYKIRTNGVLTYYDLKTESSKGTFKISKVKLSIGPIENVWDLEANGVSCDAIAVNIYSSDEMRTMELVFLSKVDVKTFCDTLLKASTEHNVKVR